MSFVHFSLQIESHNIKLKLMNDERLVITKVLVIIKIKCKRKLKFDCTCVPIIIGVKTHWSDRILADGDFEGLGAQLLSIGVEKVGIWDCVLDGT